MKLLSKKVMLWGAAGIAIILGSGELGARYGLGLGTPALSISDPQIEYMFAPNQDTYRFGNHLVYNEVGMRSPPLQTVSQPHRVIVFGDSVLNGGNRIDQADLATSRATDQATFFGNVSAKSWGPANMVAWIDRFGFQASETAILVLNSHDFADLPTYAPLDPNTHPTHPPLSALVEGMSRYLPRYLPWSRNKATPATARSEETKQKGMEQVNLLVDRVADAGLSLCMVQHFTRSELRGSPDEGHDDLQQLLHSRGVPTLDDAPMMAQALAAGRSPYLDNIHLTAEGQSVLGKLLPKCAALAKVPSKE